MKVLVACEYSGVVRDSFREAGHDAYSCDILPTDSNPRYHIRGDVLDQLDDGWDLMIAHPPCTYLSVTGNKHYANSKKRLIAAEFVAKLWNAPIEKICIENPVGVLNSYLPYLPKPQYVQPWMFKDPVQKKTGLWLKNLPPLIPEITEKPEIEYVEFESGKRMNKWYYETSCLPQEQRAHVRSKTFPGLARAMAEQWG